MKVTTRSYKTGPAILCLSLHLGFSFDKRGMCLLVAEAVVLGKQRSQMSPRIPLSLCFLNADARRPAASHTSCCALPHHGGLYGLASCQVFRQSHEKSIEYKCLFCPFCLSKVSPCFIIRKANGCVGILDKAVFHVCFV